MLIDWAGSMAGMLIDTSLRMCALVAVVWVVLFGGRVRSSVLRHRAWTAALMGALCMPALAFVVPAVRVPLPDAVPRVGFEFADRDSDAMPADDQPIAAAGAPRAATSLQPAATRRLSPAAAPGSAARPAWPLFVMFVYLAGLSWSLLSLGAGWRRAWRMARAAVPVAGASAPGVFESSGVATPVIVGVLSPRILLPVCWRRWPADTLRAVLAHERTHVRRRDPVVALVARVSRCFFWFHPVAWWLQQRIAADAEHVCDEAAAREVGQPSDYARILLDMAAAVRANRGRLAWQGVGVGGNGLLERRIDRVLRGVLDGRPTRTATLGVVVACSAALLLVVSCQRQVSPPPLRENAKEAERIAKQKADQALHRAAGEMTAAQVTALEASLGKGPNDLETMKTLRMFYQASGAKAFGWNDMIVRRRRHILWLIATRPDDDLAIWRVSRTADPEGYAIASAAWNAQTAKPGVSALTLRNASGFFSGEDDPLAEQLLFRARALVPGGLPYEKNAPESGVFGWSSYMGNFYGRILAGPRDPNDGRPTTPLGQDAFAQDVRRRVLESDDVTMLASAGQRLGFGMSDPVRRTLARQLFERARRLDPVHTRARVMLAALDDSERSRLRRQTIRERQAELAGGDLPRKMAGGISLSPEEQEQLRSYEYEVVLSLPEPERLAALVDLAESAYMWAENRQHTNGDPASVNALWERSKRAAQDALTLAPKLSGRPDSSDTVYRATVALALHALREGNRKAAVDYMRKAGDVPPPSESHSQSMPGLGSRLVNYLLKAGERESVAVFLEKSAPRTPLGPDQLLRDAAAIRTGEMPLSYQHAFAR